MSKQPGEGPGSGVRGPGTATQLAYRWANIVAEVTRGYQSGIEEYEDEMRVRQDIQDLMSAGVPLTARAMKVVRVADERYLGVVQPTKIPLVRDAATDAFWYRSIPRHVAGDLREDAEALGML